MPKVPIVSGEEAVRTLKRLGFTLDRQRGNHAILKKRPPNGEIGCVIPMHREIAAGTLRSALKMAGIETSPSCQPGLDENRLSKAR